jgi:hypothetical protein
MPAFTKYIERCQSFLQWGEPDNDLLVYLPYYDMIYEQPDRLALFDIHSMERRAPKFIHTIQSIIRNSYDVDYISDKYLAKTAMKGGSLTTTGKNKYAGIIVPDVRFMPLETLKQLIKLADKGATVVFTGSLPKSVPGYLNEAEQEQFERIIGNAKKMKNIIVANTTEEGLAHFNARPEHMRKTHGLSCIRRSNPDGYHYFISNLQGKDVDAWVAIGTEASEAAFYNPMNGSITKAQTRQKEGATQVRMQLASGESVILRTFAKGSADKIMAESGKKGPLPAHKYTPAAPAATISLNSGWTLSFKDCAPEAPDTLIRLDAPKSWTELGCPTLSTMMGTGVYTTEINLRKTDDATYIIDLGDVRESARLWINGHNCGTLFAVPYRTDITPYIKSGSNTIKVEVTNLAANRIAELDRQGVVWRKFKEINVVDLNYKKTSYAEWQTVPSGLNSEVRITVY